MGGSVTLKYTLKGCGTAYPYWGAAGTGTITGHLSAKYSGGKGSASATITVSVSAGGYEQNSWSGSTSCTSTKDLKCNGGCNKLIGVSITGSVKVTLSDLRPCLCAPISISVSFSLRVSISVFSVSFSYSSTIYNNGCAFRMPC